MKASVLFYSKYFIISLGRIKTRHIKEKERAKAPVIKELQFDNRGFLEFMQN
jgi:hypothetical protein